jgi:hypothetical protein
LHPPVLEARSLFKEALSFVADLLHFGAQRITQLLILPSLALRLFITEKRRHGVEKR